MSYCLTCGARPGEHHMRICPHSANPTEWVATSQSASDAFNATAEPDRSSGGTRAVRDALSASREVGGWAHAS